MASRRFVAAIVLSGALAPGPQSATAQSPPTLDRVLAFPVPISGEALQADRGAAGVWHRIRKLKTTASILHVTAHPDDEHSGMLTLASRSWGARTALLSLNRGEAGANAIGPELFDALGLIRARELVLSGRYYGLDDLYFTTAVDYGYSKSVEEAFRSWDREAVLEGMVRVIRLNRPLVVVSRFHGSRRDGHGHHHAAGLLTPEAVAAAADPARFPEQITREGLRPWRVLRVFRGGLRVDEAHHVAVGDAYSPLLGMSYQQWASLGLSLQRSQTSGRVRAGGERVYRYERLGRREADEVADEVASDFFTGLDTSLPGLPGLLGEELGDGITEVLAELHSIVERALEDFDFNAPERSVPGLLRGHELLRDVADEEPLTPETSFHLAVKRRQFEDAIFAAAGVEVRAVLDIGGGVVSPGEEIDVAVRIESPLPGWERAHYVGIVHGRDTLNAMTIRWEEIGGTGGADAAARFPEQADQAAHVFEDRLPIRVPPEPTLAGPYFARNGLAENHYEVEDSTDLHLPWRVTGLRAVVALEGMGATLARTVPVNGIGATAAVRIRRAPRGGAAGAVGGRDPGSACGARACPRP